MQLPVPIPSVDDGPQWATDVQNSLNIIDAHNHAPGSGVPIGPNGMNINADLPINSHNLTSIRSVRFSLTATGSIPGVSPDLACIFVSTAGELYYNDNSGNQVQITSGGNVNAGAGSITGLPSGTASVTYTALSGTYTFQQATSTAANIDAATLIVRYPGSYPSITGNGIAIQAPSSLASSYALTLPAIPVAQSFMTLDSSGNISAPWRVDSNTLVITGGTTLKVKDGGITATQIANSTITTNQISPSANITGGQIAASTITATNIVNNTITSNKIQGDVNLPGAEVRIGDLSAVTMAGDLGGAVKIIRGIVSLGGTISVGENFTIPSSAGGTYNLSFVANQFSGTPVIVVSCLDTPGRSAITNSITPTTAVVGTFNTATGALTPAAFSFIAIGPR